MSKFFNKIFFLYLIIILSNILTVDSIKERVIWFGSNRSELNSSETMDYYSNSSAEQLSSNALNERIANDLDVIERDIKVNIQQNKNKIEWKDSKYTMDSLKQKLEDKNKQKLSEFEYQREDNLDLYVERNLLNVQNISENRVEFPVIDNNSNKRLNKVLLNHSFIDSDNIEIEKLFFNESEAELNSNKTTVPMNEKSQSISLIKTTTTTINLNDVSNNVISFSDRDLKNSKSKGNGNIYKNKVIITLETSDLSPNNSMTTTETNRSNSLIDRLKYLSEKQINKERTKNHNSNIVPQINVCQKDCEQFLKSINQSVSGDYLTIRFESKTCVKGLCFYLSCARNECENQNWESLCKTPQNCSHIRHSECNLKLNNFNNNTDCEVKYININYACANNGNESRKVTNCTTIDIQFNQEKPESDNRVVVIITATVVPIIICVAIFTFVCTRRNRNMKKFDCFGVKILKQMPYRSKSRKRRVDKMPTDASAGTTVINMEEVSQQQHKIVSKSKSVTFDEFCEYYQKRRADSGLKLAEEYEELKEVTAKKRSMKISQFTLNKAKNRFVNILPYDHSIVPLSVRNGVIGSDYINANFIDGFNCDKEYIASQGPLYSTVNDFFRMIIEHNIKIIVCLTQCIEKGRSKCEKYWPNRDDIDDNDEQFSHSTVPKLTFDDITIELINETLENDFIVRELKLIKDGLEHSVTQYHFIQWPDFGCPQNPFSLINLIEVIRKKFRTISETNSTECQQRFYSPILVHCSAGVGRSGTFIAVDKIMQMIDNRLKCDGSGAKDKDISIDIFGTVCDMRRNRPNMVQTEDQYILIYDCVKYLIDKFEKKIKTQINDKNGENNEHFDENTCNEQNNERNNNEFQCSEDEDLVSGAHINRQFSLDESSENTEL